MNNVKKIYVKPLHTRFEGIWKKDNISSSINTPLSDYNLTMQHNINNLNEALNFLNDSDSGWPHSIAYYTDENNKIYKLWCEPKKLIGPFDKWDIVNTKKQHKDAFNPLLDITSKVNGSVANAIKLLNSNNIDWPYDSAYIYSSRLDEWYKIFRVTVQIQPLRTSKSITDNYIHPTIVALDFDLTLTCSHIYQKWMQSGLSVNNFLQGIDPVNYIVTKHEKNPIKVLKKYFDILLLNNIKLYIVTYGYKRLVAGFFEALGMEKYFNNNNILGWKEGFAQFNEPELKESNNPNLFIKYGKNTFLLEILKQENLNINETDIYLIDDTPANIDALKLIKNHGKLVGITDYTNKKPGTKYFLNKLLQKLIIDKKVKDII